MKEEHEATEINVHEILMGDVEDPDLMIAAPIYEWQQTEAGRSSGGFVPGYRGLDGT